MIETVYPFMTRVELGLSKRCAHKVVAYGAWAQFCGDAVDAANQKCESHQANPLRLDELTLAELSTLESVVYSNMTRSLAALPFQRRKDYAIYQHATYRELRQTYLWVAEQVVARLPEETAMHGRAG